MPAFAPINLYKQVRDRSGREVTILSVWPIPLSDGRQIIGLVHDAKGAYVDTWFAGGSYFLQVPDFGANLSVRDLVNYE